MRKLRMDEILAYETDFKNNHVIELVMNKHTFFTKSKRILPVEEAVVILHALAGNEDDEELAKDCQAMLARLGV